MSMSLQSIPERKSLDEVKPKVVRKVGVRRKKSPFPDGTEAKDKKEGNKKSRNVKVPYRVSGVVANVTSTERKGRGRSVDKKPRTRARGEPSAKASGVEKNPRAKSVDRNLRDKSVERRPRAGSLESKSVGGSVERTGRDNSTEKKALDSSVEVQPRRSSWGTAPRLGGGAAKDAGPTIFTPQPEIPKATTRTSERGRTFERGRPKVADKLKKKLGEEKPKKKLAEEKPKRKLADEKPKRKKKLAVKKSKKPVEVNSLPNGNDVSALKATQQHDSEVRLPTMGDSMIENEIEVLTKMIAPPPRAASDSPQRPPESDCHPMRTPTADQAEGLYTRLAQEGFAHPGAHTGQTHAMHSTAHPHALHTSGANSQHIVQSTAHPCGLHSSGQGQSVATSGQHHSVDPYATGYPDEQHPPSLGPTTYSSGPPTYQTGTPTYSPQNSAESVSVLRDYHASDIAVRSSEVSYNPAEGKTMQGKHAIHHGATPEAGAPVIGAHYMQAITQSNQSPTMQLPTMHSPMMQSPLKQSDVATNISQSEFRLPEGQGFATHYIHPSSRNSPSLQRSPEERASSERTASPVSTKDTVETATKASQTTLQPGSQSRPGSATQSRPGSPSSHRPGSPAHIRRESPSSQKKAVGASNARSGDRAVAKNDRTQPKTRGKVPQTHSGRTSPKLDNASTTMYREVPKAAGARVVGQSPDRGPSATPSGRPAPTVNVTTPHTTIPSRTIYTNVIGSGHPHGTPASSTAVRYISPPTHGVSSSKYVPSTSIPGPSTHGPTSISTTNVFAPVTCHPSAKYLSSVNYISSLGNVISPANFPHMKSVSPTITSLAHSNSPAGSAAGSNYIMVSTGKGFSRVSKPTRATPVSNYVPSTSIPTVNKLDSKLRSKSIDLPGLGFSNLNRANVPEFTPPPRGLDVPKPLIYSRVEIQPAFSKLISSHVSKETTRSRSHSPIVARSLSPTVVRSHSPTVVRSQSPTVEQHFSQNFVINTAKSFGVHTPPLPAVVRRDISPPQIMSAQKNSEPRSRTPTPEPGQRGGHAISGSVIQGNVVTRTIDSKGRTVIRTFSPSAFSSQRKELSSLRSVSQESLVYRLTSAGLTPPVIPQPGIKCAAPVFSQAAPILRTNLTPTSASPAGSGAAGSGRQLGTPAVKPKEVGPKSSSSQTQTSHTQTHKLRSASPHSLPQAQHLSATKTEKCSVVEDIQSMKQKPFVPILGSGGAKVMFPYRSLSSTASEATATPTCSARPRGLTSEQVGGVHIPSWNTKLE